MNKQNLRELKFNRLKPEERFLIDIFDGLIKEESLTDKGYFLYMKDSYCYFYHDTKNKHFWYDYNAIRSVFNSKFNYNNNQTDEFIKVMIEKHLNLKNITTNGIDLHDSKSSKKDL